MARCTTADGVEPPSTVLLPRALMTDLTPSWSRTLLALAVELMHRWYGRGRPGGSARQAWAWCAQRLKNTWYSCCLAPFGSVRSMRRPRQYMLWLFGRSRYATPARSSSTTPSGANTASGWKIAPINQTPTATRANCPGESNLGNKVLMVGDLNSVLKTLFYQAVSL